MKEILVKGFAVMSITMLCFSLICGIWVGTHETSDLSFHAILCGISAVLAIVSQLLLLKYVKATR